jgi:hypothetical protein
VLDALDSLKLGVEIAASNVDGIFSSPKCKVVESFGGTLK